MRLPERFVITIEGEVAKARRRDIIAPGGLPHLLTRLLTGQPVAEEAWAAFGLRVSVEEDCDQGEG